MTIELTTASETAPLEVLDLQVTTRRSAGSSRLSVRFMCYNGRFLDHLQIPTLSWFDASQLQRFSQTLALSRFPNVCQTDLTDAGLRLTGSVRRQTGRQAGSRVIRIEPLPTAIRQFEPFTIHASYSDVAAYAHKLYNRLWEVFLRG